MSGQLINKVEQYIPLELVEKNSIEIAKLIKCPICEGIVWNPIKGKCEDYFCENCFNYSIKNKSYCPKHNKIKIEKSDSKNFKLDKNSIFYILIFCIRNKLKYNFCNCNLNILNIS